MLVSDGSDEEVENEGFLFKYVFFFNMLFLFNVVDIISNDLGLLELFDSDFEEFSLFLIWLLWEENVVLFLWIWIL